MTELALGVVLITAGVALAAGLACWHLAGRDDHRPAFKRPVCVPPPVMHTGPLQAFPVTEADMWWLTRDEQEAEPLWTYQTGEWPLHKLLIGGGE